MSLADRALIAATVLAIDLVAFAVPLCALFLAFVVVARPRWFLRLAHAIYAEPSV